MGKQTLTSKPASGLAKVREKSKLMTAKHTKAIKKDSPAAPLEVIKRDRVIIDKKKKTRPSSKKRRFLKLLAEQPQRDAKPADLREL